MSEADPIMRHDDNPHELVILKCDMCFEKQTDSRESLNENGWKTWDDEIFLCPECSAKFVTRDQIPCD